MTDVIQSTASQSGTIAESRSTLMNTLDDLLEHYLNLLHEYQRLRSNLADYFSSGFLALAQANFSNPHRVRYGQDLYDERMQASTHIKVNSSSPIFSVLKAQPTKGFNMTEALKDTASPGASSGDSPNTIQSSDSQPIGTDPIRWFGLFSPPALRSSQQQFKSAIAECIPQLANTANEMKLLEIEVRRTRKKLRKMR